MSLEFALAKLKKTEWTIASLPDSVIDPLWNEVRRDCELNGPELSLLKKEVARIQGARLRIFV